MRADLAPVAGDGKAFEKGWMANIVTSPAGGANDQEFYYFENTGVGTTNWKYGGKAGSAVDLTPYAKHGYGTGEYQKKLKEVDYALREDDPNYHPYNHLTDTQGMYMNYSGNNIILTANATYNTTDYIECKEGDVFELSNDVNHAIINRSIMFFAAKTNTCLSTSIKNGVKYGSTRFTVPAGANYFRFDYGVTTVINLKVSFLSSGNIKKELYADSVNNIINSRLSRILKNYDFNYFNQNSTVTGIRLSVSGTNVGTTADALYSVSDYISVVYGYIVEIKSSIATDLITRSIVFYANKGTVCLSGSGIMGSSGDIKFTVPDGCNFIRFDFYTAAKHNIRVSISEGLIKRDLLGQEVGMVTKDRLYSVYDPTSDVVGNSLEVNGTTVSNSPNPAYNSTNYIKCNPGDVVQIANNNSAARVVRDIVFYNVKGNVCLPGSSMSINYRTAQFIAPENCNYFRFDYSASDVDNLTVTISPGKLKEEVLNNRHIDILKEPSLQRITNTNIDNNSIQINHFTRTARGTLQASVIFNDVVSVKVGRRGSYLSSNIVIDNSTIKLYYQPSTSGGGTETLLATYDHGLNIVTGNTLVVLIEKNVRTTKITLLIDTDTFTVETDPSIIMAQWFGSPFIESTSNVTVLNLSWDNISDCENPIYLYGDSYSSMYSADTWINYLPVGFDKISGHTMGGDIASVSITQLITELTYYRPKILIFAMTVNGTIGNVQGGFIPIANYCKFMGIDIVIMVPPPTERGNVTQADKAEWIRNSGYRTFDVRAEVTTGSSETTWKEGYLKADGTHPTEMASKAIAKRALQDIPELFSLCK
jgi:hypothetical protein